MGAASVPAWNGWYHVSGSTYGTWLRGDPRGWRSRHHREHVDGDYKHPPPPGTYDDLLVRSRRLMKHRPVYLDAAQRRAAGQAMVDRFLAIPTDLLCLSLDATHYHVLGRFPGGQVRRKVGLAKKHASFALSPLGLKGTVWAKRCQVKPIRNRRHQVKAFHYILDHAKADAWVWDFREHRAGAGEDDV